jgi:nitrogenase subunit NifH
MGGPTSAVCSPKRKQLAHLQDEEQRCILDDRAGTLHISEIWHEDVVNTYSNIMRMEVGGPVELDERTWVFNKDVVN